jgi:hypothetical protein
MWGWTLVSEQVEPTRAEPVWAEAALARADQAARQAQLSPEHSMCARQVVSEQVEPARVAAALAQAD